MTDGAVEVVATVDVATRQASTSFIIAEDSHVAVWRHSSYPSQALPELRHDYLMEKKEWLDIDEIL